MRRCRGCDFLGLKFCRRDAGSAKKNAKKKMRLNHREHGDAPCLQHVWSFRGSLCGVLCGLIGFFLLYSAAWMFRPRFLV